MPERFTHMPWVR